ICEVKAAKLEWSYWVSSGVTFGDGRKDVRATLGVGAELTFHLFEYRGFPAAQEHSLLGRAESRLGPWFFASDRFDGTGLVEGGAKIHFGGIAAPSWGTFDARVGFGYGALAPRRAAFVTAT